MAMNWDTVQFSFSAGLQQRGDKRVQNPPYCDSLLDAEFDDIGGLRTRKAFAAMSNNILGGGALSNCRRLAVNGDELLVFTDTALYSWSARDSAWVLKGTHLAVATTESTTFATNSDQVNQDRAELSSTVVFAWEDSSKVYVAAKDKTTGAVICPPTAISGTATRPRLLALQTKIVLLYHSGTDALLDALKAKPIDPASVASSIAGAATTVLASPNFGGMYDVSAVPSSDTCVVVSQRAITTSYSIIKLTAAMSVTPSTKARTCDGPIAVSVDPTGTSAQVARANGTNVQGDLIAISALTDTFTGQAIGAPGIAANQIAAAHRSVQNGGAYRCYVFWSAGEDPTNAGGFVTQSNWVDTGNTLGSAATFVAWVGVGSRAFSYSGSVYVWLTFGQTSGLGAGAANASSTGNFQNSYFLYRDDQFLAAKAVYSHGGGLLPSKGMLPNVALTSGSTAFSWCASERRIISVGTGTAGGALAPQPSTYSMRAPQDVTFTFDSDAARRSVRLGQTLYIAAGEILQYDGNLLVETGWHVYPWYFDAIVSATGSIANGTYGYKSTYRYNNARGETDRSTTALLSNATMTGGPSGLAITTISTPITHKTTYAPADEIWRTVVSPTSESPFYLVTSRDPSVTSNPNRYLANVTTGGFNATVRDGYADSTLTTGETNPENGGILEALAPPGASLIAANDERIFLGGVPGDPDRFWYSRQRNDGEIASFNDALTVRVPSTGGAITALSILNETLIAFRERAIYAFPGDGFDNLGGGSNYGPARVISSDCGAVNQESVVVTDEGLLFKSYKGWYRLNRGWQLEYVGAGVVNYDSETVLAAHVVKSQQQVRILSSSRMLIWDYLVNQWGEDTISDGLDSVMWQGSHVYLTSTGPEQEAASNSTATYGMVAETAWIKMADLQGAGRVRQLEVLGEFASACRLHMQVAYDYKTDVNGTWLYIDDTYLTPSPQIAGGQFQMQHGARFGRCEAIKVRLSVVGTSSSVAGTLAIGGGITVTAVNAGKRPVYVKVLSDWTGAGAYVNDVGNVVMVHFNPDITSGGTSSANIVTALASSSLVTVTANTTPTYVWGAIDVINETPLAGGTDAAVSGAGLKLTGLALEVGRKPGINRQLPAAQRG